MTSGIGVVIALLLLAILIVMLGGGEALFLLAVCGGVLFILAVVTSWLLRGIAVVTSWLLRGIAVVTSWLLRGIARMGTGGFVVLAAFIAMVTLFALSGGDDSDNRNVSVKRTGPVTRTGTVIRAQIEADAMEAYRRCDDEHYAILVKVLGYHPNMGEKVERVCAPGGV